MMQHWAVLLPAKNLEGHIVVGPFTDRDHAYQFAEASPGDYTIVPIWTPDAIRSTW